MTLWLSRVRLRRDPSAEALSALIDPEADANDCEAQGRRHDAHHRLVWTLFAGDREARRDFLWRAEGDGAFTILSHRPPVEAPLFEPPETRPFTPNLAPGDRLGFLLRANATKARSGVGRVDVVMDRLHGIPKQDRPERRMDVAHEAATEWMKGLGQRKGFAPLRVAVQHYSTATLPGYRGKRRGEPRYGLLDLDGILTVNDPETFIAALAAGFGRAKAFGCGLMLLRRA
mgnify:FL=1